MTESDYVALIQDVASALRSFRAAADPADRKARSDRLHEAGIRLANAVGPDNLTPLHRYHVRRVLDDARAALIAAGAGGERPEYLWHMPVY